MVEVRGEILRITVVLGRDEVALSPCAPGVGG